MPGPIRRPLAHPVANVIINDAAITLFERGLRCTTRGDEGDALNRLSYELGSALKLRPWHFCPFDTVGYSAPPGWMKSEAERADWFRSAGIRDQLQLALKARRKARRQSKAAGGAPSAPPKPEQPSRS
jgi:hypothetical protein